jgi:hypothetical protein
MERSNRIHSRCGRRTRLALAVLGAGLSLGLGGAGASEPERLPPEEAQSRPPRWLGENWFYTKHVGLEYRRELKLGDLAIELGLQGPLVRKKKRAGVTVEIRF